MSKRFISGGHDETCKSAHMWREVSPLFWRTTNRNSMFVWEHLSPPRHLLHIRMALTNIGKTQRKQGFKLGHGKDGPQCKRLAIYELQKHSHQCKENSCNPNLETSFHCAFEVALWTCPMILTISLMLGVPSPDDDNDEIQRSGAIADDSSQSFVRATCVLQNGNTGYVNVTGSW